MGSESQQTWTPLIDAQYCAGIWPAMPVHAGKGPVGADEMIEEEGVKEEGDTKARSAGLHVTTSLPP